MSAKMLKFAAIAIFDICIVLAIAVGIKELINKHVDRTAVRIVAEMSNNMKSCNCNKE